MRWSRADSGVSGCYNHKCRGDESAALAMEIGRLLGNFVVVLRLGWTGRDERRDRGVNDVLDGGSVLPGFEVRIADLFAAVDLSDAE